MRHLCLIVFVIISYNHLFVSCQPNPFQISRPKPPIQVNKEALKTVADTLSEISSVLTNISNALHTKTSAQRCPYPFVLREHLCLYIGPFVLTWPKSAEFCSALGGQLATMKNDGDAKVIMEHLESVSKPRNGFWLGGSDEELEGLWKWQDGTLVQTNQILYWGETSSGKQQPEHSRNQNCLLYWPSYKNGRLGDTGCSGHYHPFCSSITVV